MAKTKYDRNELLTSYQTGLFTQRQLADKYKISVSTVNSVTKGVEKKTEQLVNKIIEVDQEISSLTEQEVSAVDYAVDFKKKLIKDIERFSNKAIQKASSLIDNTDTGSDFKAVIDGVDRLSILTKINDRHAKPAQIQQNTQNNGEGTMTPTRIELVAPSERS